MSSYGCFNRKPFLDSYTVHGISKTTGMPVSTTIPFRMAKECKYQADDPYNDPGCLGCCHNQKETPHEK